MDRIVIQEFVKNSPDIVFYPSEKMLDIRGRSISENPDKLYSKMEKWFIDYFSENEEITVRFRYDYINSGSSRCLFNVLRKLKCIYDEGKDIDILWLYEDDDDSMLDLGTYLSKSIEIPFVLKEIN